MAISTPPEARSSLPPHNEEAEASVLGAILLTEQALDGVFLEVGLRPDDFYRPRHQLIFGAMVRLKEKAAPEAVDALTVSEELRRTGELESAGGEAYVHSLPTVVPALGAVLDYARIVKETALLRSVLSATREIQDDVLGRRGEARELIERAESVLFKIGHDGGTAEMRTIETVLHEEIDKLEELSRSDIGLTGTPSGFHDIDDLTGGFQPGNLIVVAARPSMGKCLSGSALVYDPVSGARRPIRDVVASVERGEDVLVASMGHDLRLHRAQVSAAARNGRRALFGVTTKLGRRVDATANHPLLTMRGWQPVESLQPGDRVAVPRRLPGAERTRALPDHELVLLAALIADGDIGGSSPRFCFGPNSTVLPEAVFGLEDAGIARSLNGLFGCGRPATHNWHVRSPGLSREPTAEIARAIAEPAVMKYARSDLWWDQIASVEPIGEDETFDLTVPDTHNFVADDMIVHNSTLATNIAENAAIEAGRPVALFSLEMSETELAHRFIASQAKVSSDELRKGRVRADRWPKVLRAVEKLARAPIYIDDSSDIGVLEMRAKARRLHARAENGLGLLIVDYLQLIRPDGRADSRVEQVGQISRGLKILARELEIPVIAVSQLSRAVESRNPPVPMLSDLRESGQVEQDADVVMFVYREEYYDRESERLGEADIIFAKHRNGPVGQVTLTFQPRFPRFSSMYRERGGEPVPEQNGGS
ncbi:MAG TPA: replicative DNA helicase [Thermoleophilaceae bacterium]|nr:replicative DNA helicase [Thermoleophilaceae bacterium]